MTTTIKTKVDWAKRLAYRKAWLEALENAPEGTQVRLTLCDDAYSRFCAIGMAMPVLGIRDRVIACGPDGNYDPIREGLGLTLPGMERVVDMNDRLRLPLRTIAKAIRKNQRMFFSFPKVRKAVAA